MSAPGPELRKSARVQGRSLVFRDAAVSDAGFILSLRTDPKKSEHLSATAPSLESQARWLDAYAASRDQAYFVIEDGAGAPIGTVRLYDPRGTSFCWGSWILVDGLGPMAALESALLVYRYALGLGFESARLSVRRGNESVWRFHENLFGAVRVSETERDIEYAVPRGAIDAAMKRFARLLP